MTDASLEPYRNTIRLSIEDSARCHRFSLAAWIDLRYGDTKRSRVESHVWDDQRRIEMSYSALISRINCASSSGSGSNELLILILSSV